MVTYTWAELGGLSLARQFPAATSVAQALAQVGPVQSQTARSPYVGLGARLPGVTHATVTAAYEAGEIVRGSSIRGTVHTSTADHQALLDATTRVGQRTLWNRMLKLDHTELDDVWAAIEDYARDSWRTPAELARFLKQWLTDHGEAGSAARLDSDAGRYFAFGHGGLLRRPFAGTWSAQGAPGYRTATAVVPGRTVPDEPLLAMARLHVASYGPTSRNDLAWWSGLGLLVVDGLLDRLDPTWREGPDGRAYADLPDASPPRDLPGVRLLPEFDALLCGYDPRARDRFVSAADNDVLWHRANGLMLAPVLVDGRIGGHWRLEGTGRTRRLEVTSFEGSRRPGPSELDEVAGTLGLALDLTIAVS